MRYLFIRDTYRSDYIAINKQDSPVKIKVNLKQAWKTQNTYRIKLTVIELKIRRPEERTTQKLNHKLKQEREREEKTKGTAMSIQGCIRKKKLIQIRTTRT